MRRRSLLAALAIASAGAAVGVAPPHTAAAASSAWTGSAASGPGAQAAPAMAWDSATGTDVLLTTTGQTWTWNGSSWTQLSPAHSPGARSNAAMAFDAAHGQAVLFGGVSGGTTLQDTWTWNGTDWTRRSPSNTPPARGGASMAWDGAAQRVLMFGGFDGVTVFYDDTWEWNGNNGNWDEQILNVSGAAAGVPSPRTLAQMSDNGANGSIVLFGGTNPEGVLDDTWVWTDTDVTFGSTDVTTEGHWVPVNPTLTPPARYSGVLAFAAGSGDVRFGGPILFGGAGASGRLQDAWSFDGSGWAQVTTTGAPAARSGAAAAAAPGGTIVVFGGVGGGGALGDTWTWSGSIDAAPLPAPTIATCPSAPVALPTTTGTGTLRGAAATSHPGFYIGAALTASQIYAADAEQQMTAGSQFNIVASSNQMWWSAIENEPYTFDFCDADQFVGYAQAYHQALLLHTLLGATPGNGQIPQWIISPVLPWTGTSLSAVLKQYISTYVDHVRGKVSAMSVVGEATDPNGVPNVNVFEQAIGYPRYVEEAFQDTDAANPQATIFYDDYHDWYGPKLAATESLVTDLHNTGSRIDAVGMEFFAAGADVESQDVPGAMATLAGAPYNVKTAVTQMTVPWFTTPEPASTSGFWDAQAGVYQYVLSACLTPASNCFMLMSWAVSDTYSEAAASISPTKGVGGALFDETYQPRKAFNAVLGLLQ